MTTILILTVICITVGYLLYILTMHKDSKDVKLLKKVLKLAKKELKKECKCSGFCSMLSFSSLESNFYYIMDILEKEILSDKYKDFPITYPDSAYYFKSYDWNIRVKWLKQVIKNYQNE